MAPNTPVASSGRTEMVGVPPKKQGRIVVENCDVEDFEADGYVVIEPTSLPLSGPGAAKKAARDAKKEKAAKDKDNGKSKEAAGSGKKSDANPGKKSNASKRSGKK